MAVNRRQTKDKSTRYTVVMSSKDPKTGRMRRRSVGTFTRRKEADAAERKAKIEIDAGVFDWNPVSKSTDAPEDTTVAKVCRDWVNTKAMNLRKNTIAGYQVALEEHLIPALGNVPVDELRYSQIQNVVSQWHSDYQKYQEAKKAAQAEGTKPPMIAGCGPQTINRAMLVLRGALDQQMKSGVISANAAVGVVKPSPKSRKELAQWTDAETARFLNEASQDQLASFWFLTFLEGMRRGEALGLRWSDLKWSDDESRCSATINRTVVPDQANGGATLIQEGQAKTKASRRTVQLTNATVEMLKITRDRQKFQRRELGASWTAGDAICTTTIGSIPRPDSIRKMLDALIEAAKVPTVTTHSLRHMAATRMLQAGISPALVALKMGHSDIGTTVGTYGHLVTEDQAPANTAIDAAITRAMKAV